jgi:lipopolysaccharide export system protein LptC
MALRDATYSRVVAWLKILLPLAALGLLSTLFLLSRTTDPMTTIPYLENGARPVPGQERVSRPSYSGSTEGGASLTVTALEAVPGRGDEGRATALDVEAEAVLRDGSRVTLSAGSAAMDEASQRLEFAGTVRITSSSGYSIEASGLVANLETLVMESLGAVSGTGPPGRFEAGRMVLESGEDGANGAQLLFTDGIKLVYDPQS